MTLELNLLTLNICIHVPGGRNTANIWLVSRSIMCTVTVANLVLFLKRGDTDIGLLFLFSALTLPLGLFFGQFGALILSYLIYLVKKNKFSEFKSERQNYLCENDLGTRDIVALQELYGGWLPGSRFYRDRMKSLCNGVGLKFYAFAGRPSFPKLLFDQGLAIFSRFPVTESERLVFRTQSIWDYLFVARSCLYAKIEVPGNELENSRVIHCFTVHTAPSLKDMKERTILANVIKEKIPTVRRQADEIGAFVKKKVGAKDHHSLIVVMGDFNIQAGSDDYMHLENVMAAQGLKDVTNGENTFALLDESGKAIETLLTTKGLQGKPQALDFVFINEGKCVKATTEVLPFRNTSEDTWQAVSDHAGVSAKVQLD